MRLGRLLHHLAHAVTAGGQSMRLLEILQTSNEKIFINPCFVVSVWHENNEDTMIAMSSNSQGTDAEVLHTKAPLEMIVGRIDDALKR
jgi:hypothetical protein